MLGVACCPGESSILPLSESSATELLRDLVPRMPVFTLNFSSQEDVACGCASGPPTVVEKCLS
jgi:hypothetical protein